MKNKNYTYGDSSKLTHSLVAFVMRISYKFQRIFGEIGISNWRKNEVSQTGKKSIWSSGRQPFWRSAFASCVFSALPTFKVLPIHCSISTQFCADRSCGILSNTSKSRGSIWESKWFKWSYLILAWGHVLPMHAHDRSLEELEQYSLNPAFT